MYKKSRNLLAFWLAVVSAVFLFLSGTTGVSSWIKVEEIVLKYADFYSLNLFFTIVLIVASFGGIAVLVGGFFILKGRTFLGKALILFGSGAGLIGFLINLFISLVTLNFSIYSYLSFSSLGVLFAVAAQIVSRNKRRRKRS